jgi:hypothetical protein
MYPWAPHPADLAQAVAGTRSRSAAHKHLAKDQCCTNGQAADLAQSDANSCSRFTSAMANAPLEDAPGNMSSRSSRTPS